MNCCLQNDNSVLRRRTWIVVGSVLVYVSCAHAGPVAHEMPSQDRTARALAGLSAQEAFHSTLFKGLSDQSRILDHPGTTEVNVLPATAGKPLSTEAALRVAICAADVLVSVRVTGRQSYPTSDGSFLYTTYTGEVNAVLRVAGGIGLRPSAIIQFVRPGGKVQLDGTVVEAVHNAFPSLVEGGDYYMLLTRLERFGTFLNATYDGTLSRDNGRLRSVGLRLDEGLANGISEHEFERIAKTAKCSATNPDATKHAGGASM